MVSLLSEIIQLLVTLSILKITVYCTGNIFNQPSFLMLLWVGPDLLNVNIWICEAGGFYRPDSIPVSQANTLKHSIAVHSASFLFIATTVTSISQLFF